MIRKVKSVYWYDVRSGKSILSKSVKGNRVRIFTPPKGGKDWVLVIDDASKKFEASGIIE